MTENIPFPLKGMCWQDKYSFKYITHNNKLIEKNVVSFYKISGIIVFLD